MHSPFQPFCSRTSSAAAFERPFSVRHGLRKEVSYYISSMFSLLARSARAAVCAPTRVFARYRTQLAPKSVKYAKRYKGRIPIPTGGSTKGTTLAYGEWGIRIKSNGARITAKQLLTAEEVIKKKIKIIKGSKVYLRVFPDIPVCVKVHIIHRILSVLLLTKFSVG